MEGLLVICWYFVGVVVFIYTCYRMNGEVVIKDLLVSTVAGWFGPFNLVFLLLCGNFDFMNKRIF